MMVGNLEWHPSLNDEERENVGARKSSHFQANLSQRPLLHTNL